MRPIALGLLLAASFSLPGFAAEPDGPATLITPDRSRADYRSGPALGQVRCRDWRDQKDALIEYYSAPDQRLLWVDDNGLTERAKMVMAEIAKADDYGLRASDYTLPDAAAFNASDAEGQDWLADAEVKVSYAVLGYAKDARGGRIDRLRLSKNLDPTLALPSPSEVLESIAIRSDPAAYLRSFQPDQPQFEALRQKLIELRGGKVEEVKPAVVTIPDGPVLKFGMVHEQVALLRKRLDVPAGQRRNQVRRGRARGGAAVPVGQRRATPTAWSAPARGGMLNSGPAAARRWQARRGSRRSWSIWSAGAGCPTISAPSM